MTAPESPSMHAPVLEIDPATLEQWLREGSGVLVDVREDVEHAEERIDGATSFPLSRFNAEALRERLAGQRVVFHCRSGKRSNDAARRYAQTLAPGTPVHHLAGGIEAWKAAGKPTVKPQGRRVLPLMRQVQVVAGSLVVVGVLLGVLISPWLLIIAGFVGAGLVFAGLSGWCGMAMLLAKMPWNRVRPAPGDGASCAPS